MLTRFRFSYLPGNRNVWVISYYLDTFECAYTKVEIYICSGILLFVYNRNSRNRHIHSSLWIGSEFLTITMQLHTFSLNVFSLFVLTVIQLSFDVIAWLRIDPSHFCWSIKIDIKFFGFEILSEFELDRSRSYAGFGIDLIWHRIEITLWVALWQCQLLRLYYIIPFLPELSYVYIRPKD
jgi:hypothetical protein